MRDRKLAGLRVAEAEARRLEERRNSACQVGKTIGTPSRGSEVAGRNRANPAAVA